VPLWQTLLSSIYLFHNNNFNDFICRLHSFIFLTLFLVLKAQASFVLFHLLMSLLLQPLLPVVAVLVLDRSLSALVFHILLNFFDLG
jgi:uncharacterized membrane protein